MKLDSVDPLTDPDGLMVARFRPGQPHSPGRQVEGVFVELEYWYGIGQPGEYRVHAGGLRQLYVRPAGFLHSASVHSSSEGFGDQLRPQTNAENRLPPLRRLANQLQFTTEDV